MREGGESVGGRGGSLMSFWGYVVCLCEAIFKPTPASPFRQCETDVMAVRLELLSVCKALPATLSACLCNCAGLVITIVPVELIF